jgi:hypothetical protein
MMPEDCVPDDEVTNRTADTVAGAVEHHGQPSSRAVYEREDAGKKRSR